MEAKGPDRVLSGATSLSTSNPDGFVLLRNPEESLSHFPPLSVPTLLKTACEESPQTIAMAVKRNNEWMHWNYKQYYTDSKTIAKAFIKLGLERFRSVGILGFNAPEWFISQNAAIMAGGLSCGIYTTNSADACKYIAKNCSANILIVEDDHQLQKISSIKDDLPELKAIVQYLGKPKQKDVLSWEELIQIGMDETDEVLESRLTQMAINQCCSLIYTSGTTGQPKGVMLSHDNLTYTARVATKFLELTKNDKLLSYLPLSHSAAQMMELFMPMTAQCSVFFADRDALKGSLIATLREVRPTGFLGVPRVYEKIQERMLEIGKSVGGVRRVMANWAKKQGMQHNLRMLDEQAKSTKYSYPIAKKLVFSKVKRNLGVDNCRMVGSGAAPVSRETFDYFLSLDMPIYECYGMSETSGPQTGSKPGCQRLGTAGKCLEGCEMKILDPESDGNGEIVVSGRNVMMGYLHNEELTKNAIDEEGWLHSGDIGRVLEDGFVEVTGRIKELIITAGGENIPPLRIEEAIKKELPCVSNTMVIGDKRKFLACLLTLKVNIDQDTLEPSSELAPAALDWCKEIGSDAKTVEEAAKDDLVKSAIQNGMDKANAQSISNAQKVQKWSLVGTDFSIPGGELGPTLKLKRHFVLKKYDTLINNFYNNV